MAHSANMAWWGTCAGHYARPGPARNLQRLLVAAGVGAACWLIGMLFASTAHAAEPSDDAGASPGQGLLGGVVSVGLDTLTADHATAANEDHSRLLGAVTDTTLDTVERTAGSLLDKTADTTQVGLDDVTALLPAEPPENSAHEPSNRAPVPRAPAERTPDTPQAGAPQPQPNGYSGREIPRTDDVRAANEKDSAAETPTTRTTERTRVDDQDVDRSHRAAQRSTTPAGTSAADSESPAQTPNAPLLPSPPSPPATSATGTTHTQDSSHHGKHPGALTGTLDAAVRFAPATAGSERASGEAGGIPAQPGASPD